MKTVAVIVALGVIVGGLCVLNSVVRSEDGQSLLHVARELEIEVEATRPELREIFRTVQAPGEVEAFDEVDISSELVSKIIELPLEEGDCVQQGDLVCRLDDADYRARVLQAEANVAKLQAVIVQAEADLEKAQRDWEQQQQLRETHATSAMELANYRTALIKAGALLEIRKQELIEAEALRESAREDLAKTVITAPLTGVVSQRFAEPGEVVITGTMNNPGTRIMVISDLSKMQVRCRVDEADAPLVAPGQTARIYLQSDTRRSIPGEVLRVGTKGTKPVGRDVVTFETLVLITGQDQRVKPGMSANIEIEVARREQALVIPVETVVYRKRADLPAEIVQAYDAYHQADGTGTRQSQAEYVKVVFCIEDGKARPHFVETGINDATGVEIVAGLSAGDEVITGPYRSLDQLKEGSPVKAKKPGEGAAAESPTSAPTSAPTTAPTTTQPAAADEDSRS
ncbi:MAG: efflux RND transporter periplasmic adaptor subunit [Phycisphaerae bacterium]